MMINEKKPEALRKVFIVDDHPLICDAVTRAINLEPDLAVCGEADNAESALEAIESLKPDIVVIDLSLPGISGLELIGLIKSKYPNIPTMALSMHNEATHAARALRAGAKGYIMKNEKIIRILEAIHAVLDGKIWIKKDVMGNVIEGCLGEEDDPFGVRKMLSKRELEIFELLGKGASAEEIASQLHISRRTVDSHRDHIKSKLDLPDSRKLYQIAYHWANEFLKP